MYDKYFVNVEICSKFNERRGFGNLEATVTPEGKELQKQVGSELLVRM